MKERFVGQTLLGELRRQDLVNCDDRAARYLARICRCIDVPAGRVLIKDGDTTSEVYMILRGTVDIFLKGKLVATRTAGQHVGEMAALLESKRTATVIAREDCVLAMFTRTAFLAAGEKFPTIWRGIARVLGQRLDQRRNLIREPNPVPKIFVASASESLPVARLLKVELADPAWDIQVWNEDGVFPPSSITIEQLTTTAMGADFGIIVFGRDDKTTKRKSQKDAPRDNVLLEAGIFIGAIGLKRTFILVPTGGRFHMPSDLEGVACERYKRTARKIDIAVAVRKLRQQIRHHWVR